MMTHLKRIIKAHIFYVGVGVCLASCSATEKNADHDAIFKNYIGKSQKDLSSDTVLEHYVQSETYQKRLLQYTLLLDKKLGHPSRPHYKIENLQIHVIQPMAFSNEHEHPISGMWRSRHQMMRQGKKLSYNVIFKANQGKPPLGRAQPMGTTLADFTLIRDAMKQSVLHSAMIAECASPKKKLKKFDLVDTEFKNGNPPQDWNEVWIVKLNDTKLSVPIRFFKTAQQGTSFSVVANDVKCLGMNI